MDFTSAEKFQLLYELTFGQGAASENDPDFYLSRAEMKLVEVKSWLQLHFTQI